MISNMIKTELRSVIPFVIVFDVIVYLISFLFLGLNYSMLLGLLVGSALMLFNFIALGMSTERIVTRYKITGNAKASKRAVYTNYILRLFIIGIVIYLTTIDNVSFLFNIFGVFIPLFYPKLIYLLKSFKSRKEVK